jgi:two-component sensor histidine kinase/ligand-binding sensor domain-containing protein
MSLRFVLFLLTLVLISFVGNAQNRDVEFEHLSVRDGLSQVTAYSVFEDHFGFIWVGTDDGLNRYDGYDFRVFQNDPQNPKSISNNTINTMIEDADGHLWVGTDRGLNLLNRSKANFTVYQFDFHKNRSLSSNTVWSMALDSDDHLWIGTANGLNRFDKRDSSFTRFKLEFDSPGSISNNNINCLYKDLYGRLWVGTNQGLNLWDPEEELFNRLNIPEDETLFGQAILSMTMGQDSTLLVGTNLGIFELEQSSLKRSKLPIPRNMGINSLSFDKEKSLWAGTETGLYQVLTGRDIAVLHLHDDEVDRTLSNDRVTSIMEDHTGILWIGTFSGGVNIHYQEQRRFYHYDRRDMGATVFPSDHVRSIHEVSPGHYWIGTANGIGSLAEVFLESEAINVIPAEVRFVDAECIATQDSIIAIGTHQNGLRLVDLRTNTVRNIVKGTVGEGLSDSRVSDILMMDKEIWVATQGGGISILDMEGSRKSSLIFDPADKNGLKDNRITCLAKQGANTVWIGTSSAGVQRYDLDTKKFTNYKVSNDSLSTLSNDKILSMDYHSAILWIGTRGGGLNKLDLMTGRVTIYTTQNGLANNVITNVIPDGQGRIWCSTNKGISVLDISSGNFVNYNDLDGLGNQSFNTGAAIITSSGEMFFGGLQGMDVVNFQNIQLNTVLPPVFFTEIESFNVKTNSYDVRFTKFFFGDVPSFDFPPEISLITIGFTALNFRTPEKNRYEYRLVGASNDWTYVEDRRYVTFANLPPGRYFLEVKAANNDGLWSEVPGRLELNIQPSFFQTWIFRMMLIALIFLLAYLYYRYRLSRIRKVNKSLEERVKVRTQQIAKERDEKAVLLQEIHHRVKNNLQIVNSLLRLQSHYVKDEEALWALDESQNRVMSMAMIHERMYKTENLANINIRDYITDLCTDIVSTYDLSNSVNLKLNIEVEKLNLDTLTPLGLIINEISSNAMKYAFPEDRMGTFFVELVAKGEGRFELNIGDDGVGMPIDLTDTANDSLGTILMESLSEQLNGTLVRMKTTGTVYQLLFEEIKA